MLLDAAEEVPHATLAIDKAAGSRRSLEKFCRIYWSPLGTSGGRSESFGAVRPAVWVAGASIMPPRTATSPSVARKSRGRVFVSMKEECARDRKSTRLNSSHQIISYA